MLIFKGANNLGSVRLNSLKSTWFNHDIFFINVMRIVMLSMYCDFFVGNIDYLSAFEIF